MIFLEWPGLNAAIAAASVQKAGNASGAIGRPTIRRGRAGNWLHDTADWALLSEEVGWLTEEAVIELSRVQYGASPLFRSMGEVGCRGQVVNSESIKLLQFA